MERQPAPNTGKASGTRASLLRLCHPAAPEVANALKRANFHIAADQVRLKGPLKELGLYTVAIHLGSEVDAEVKVWVVPSVGEDAPGESAGK